MVAASEVPEGLRWTLTSGGGRPGVNNRTEYSFGWIYKRVLREGREPEYYKLADIEPEKSPAEIDAEPEPERTQTRYRTGSRCWFVDAGDKWFLCEVVERRSADSGITIRSITGCDASGQAQWGYGELAFRRTPYSILWKRLRPLKARQP
jgi:hypothetical protein